MVRQVGQIGLVLLVVLGVAGRLEATEVELHTAVSVVREDSYDSARIAVLPVYHGEQIDLSKEPKLTLVYSPDPQCYSFFKVSTGGPSTVGGFEFIVEPRLAPGCLGRWERGDTTFRVTVNAPLGGKPGLELKNLKGVSVVTIRPVR